MVLLTSFSFLNLYLHEQGGRALEAQWCGPVSYEFRREALLVGMELACRHRISAWIANDQKLGPISPTEIEWAVATMLPIFAEVGVTRLAFVEAEDMVNKLLIKDATRNPDASLWPFTMYSFTDVAAARLWACAAPNTAL
jgi:hypothetical protein